MGDAHRLESVPVGSVCVVEVPFGSDRGLLRARSGLRGVDFEGIRRARGGTLVGSVPPKPRKSFKVWT